MTATSLNKQKIKIVLFEGIHENAARVFKDDGYHEIIHYQKALEGQELLDAVADAHFIGIRSRSKITPQVLDAATKLSAIGCYCIGTNQVDLNAARNKGIPVFNAPFANTRSVAELVLGEILILLRGIPEKNAAAHRGQWLKSASNAYEARGKTLGIVGYGHIGTQIGLLAEALGMHVLFYDILKQLSLGNACAVNSLKALLQQSDIISFHVPETPHTRQMLNAENIGYLKAGAIVINASRGTVIDIPVLQHALETGAVRGAAIDVFPVEPESNQHAFISPLTTFDNVLLTPHIGGSTLEAQANIGIEVAEKLVHYSNNGSTMGAVNFPQVALPTHENKHRILHIHKNEPGILTRINEIFSAQKSNISAQYLQTHEGIGYVVTDVDKEKQQDILPLLKEVPGTLKARILF